ncbi:hypothetical protein CAPTEDRAFT_190067 [Capitella teleta]|uniref:Uncharacterized protein n=1 Tax=Capitella teleta TaxID=283909 RepID=R7TP05_CAPTE|nr:hypothetical protein CAPTEDRAFT_190067 [Capitella teleta]|eukprot:ELT95287.1 hypothetical protein CAPTEDRAFT_190067 [Capitella teleta]
MSSPVNVSELRSFIGSIHFYGKFVKNLATRIGPSYTAHSQEHALDLGNLAADLVSATQRLTLCQYDYTIEYRRTEDHENANVLSRLPVGEDRKFDGEETEADVDTVCTVQTGSNWLVVVDAYSKYPCIHLTTSTSSRSMSKNGEKKTVRTKLKHHGTTRPLSLGRPSQRARSGSGGSRPPGYTTGTEPNRTYLLQNVRTSALNHNITDYVSINGVLRKNKCNRGT